MYLPMFSVGVEVNYDGGNGDVLMSPHTMIY